jgi:ferrochelatase
MPVEALEFDAVVVLSFGGPDGPDDVLPFLDNVLRGRPVPPGRLQQIATHYMELGGRSPINEYTRNLVHALSTEFAGHGRPRPVYWGNRNWRPYLADTVRQMSQDGVQRAVVFATSAYSSYSSCRQYLEDIDGARDEVGRGAPELVKLRPFFNHPGFVGPLAEGLEAARLEAGVRAPVLMTAHSLPEILARTCDYERQLRQTAQLVAEQAGLSSNQWSLVYQSRSGSPDQPWLGPDVVDAIDGLPSPTRSVVVAPIGFVSDHMEVVYDLDIQAAQAASARGIKLIRSATPGVHPHFVHMVCELIDELERPSEVAPRALGQMGPAQFPCPIGCCPRFAR